METIRPALFVAMTLLSFYVSAQSMGGSLKGKLYYDLGNTKTKVAAGLKVWLIPNTDQNSKVIQQSSVYDANCNEAVLRTAKNYKVTITDKDGYYFFPNTTAGKYLIKICTYYGGFYSFTIKSNFTGTYNLPDFEADPPVKEAK